MENKEKEIHTRIQVGTETKPAAQFPQDRVLGTGGFSKLGNSLSRCSMRETAPLVDVSLGPGGGAAPS